MFLTNLLYPQITLGRRLPLSIIPPIAISDRITDIQYSQSSGIYEDCTQKGNKNECNSFLLIIYIFISNQL